MCVFVRFGWRGVIGIILFWPYVLLKSKSKGRHSLREKWPYSELFWSAFSTFGLNTERYFVSLRIQFEYGKVRTRVTPNTDTFYVVIISVLLCNSVNTARLYNREMTIKISIITTIML